LISEKDSEVDPPFIIKCAAHAKKKIWAKLRENLQDCRQYRWKSRGKTKHPWLDEPSSCGTLVHLDMASRTG